MKILTPIIAIILLLCTAFTAKADENLPADYLRNLELADSLIKESNWDSAEYCLMTALRKHPANPMNVFVMSNVGLVRYYAGRDSSALEILNQAVEMAPAAVTVLSNRAKVLTSMEQFDKAMADYNKILQLDSLVIEPRHMRGIINLKYGKVNEATEDAKFLERHFPASEEANELNAFICIATDKYAEAIPYLNKLIKLQPTATNYGERAFCHLMTDQLNEASTDLADGIRLDPLNGQLFMYRAMLNKRRYRPTDSVEDAQKAKSLGIPEERLIELDLLPHKK